MVGMELKFDCFASVEENKQVEVLPEHFQFEILLDNKYPFSQPQIFC
jgi:ACT domain-containing protein